MASNLGKSKIKLVKIVLESTYVTETKDLFLNLALITYIVLATYVVMGLFHSEVWFPLIFLVIYLIKYHMYDRDHLLKNNNINKESSLIEE